MRLKLYRAASVAEAMAQVRADLGSEALILSTRRIAQGVELTAALERADEAPAAPAPQPLNVWQFHGIPTALAARLSGQDLAAALRASLTFGALPVSDDGPALLLAGAPGAGKTLSIARLATRLVLAGAAPLIITADGRRAGAAEELAAYTRLLGLGLVVAATPANLTRALAQRQPGAPALIDTAGINPFDAVDMATLSTLAGIAGASPVLVMPAGLDPAEAADQAQAFAGIGARHLLPTRLDLVRRLGGVLAAAASADLILTEAGIGSGATDGLTPLTPEFLADRLARHQAVKAPSAPRKPVFPRANTRPGESPRTSGKRDNGYSV